MKVFKTFFFILFAIVCVAFGVVDVSASETERESNTILKDTSIESDFNILQIDSTSFKNGTDTTNRVITFAAAYEQLEGATAYDIVMYFYSPAFTLSFGDFLYIDIELTDIHADLSGITITPDSLPTGVEIWKVIKTSDFNVYKLEYINEWKTTTNSIVDIIKVFSPVKFTVSKVSSDIALMQQTDATEYSSSKFTLARNQYFQFINEGSGSSEIRNFCCVVFNEDVIAVDGICYGFTFDTRDTLWDSINGRDNKFDLFFCFFNVETNGVKWTDSKFITQVELIYTEQAMTLTEVVGYPNQNLDISMITSSKTTEGERTYHSQTVTNDAYTIKYPEDSGDWEKWLTYKVGLNEIEYKGIWTLNDSTWNETLSKSSQYDASDYSDYTFGMHYGAMDGYDRLTSEGESFGTQDFLGTTLYMCHEEITTYTKALVNDVINITYLEDGEEYFVTVNETEIEWGGFKDGEEAPADGADDEKTPLEWLLEQIKRLVEWLKEMWNKFLELMSTAGGIAVVVAIAAVVVLIINFIYKLVVIKRSRK